MMETEQNKELCLADVLVEWNLFWADIEEKVEKRGIKLEGYNGN